ncbi:hypothetical protein P4E94_07915 [Pontiellaceae bacterium B12219]|nr:hypothetical protein [Pontiellaceae bacterium B12219]
MGSAGVQKSLIGGWNMKKWLIVALVACVAAGVQATDGKKDSGKKGKDAPVTKEQFLKQMKARAEKVGKEFDPAKAEAEFKKLDKDADGVLTGAEKKKKKGPKAGAEKPRKKAPPKSDDSDDSDSE